MKKIILLSKNVLAVALALTMVLSSTAFAAVQSDAKDAGQWASTYVFEDFNSVPTGNTATYKADGTSAWAGQAGDSGNNSAFYGSIGRINSMEPYVLKQEDSGVVPDSEKRSNNQILVQYPYGWGVPGRDQSSIKGGSIGWLGSASDGFYGYYRSEQDMELINTTEAITTAPMTAHQNLAVNWNTDTVVLSYDFLVNSENYSGGNTLLLGVYDDYYNTNSKLYPTMNDNRRITYMPVVNWLNSGNMYLKYWDTNNSNGAFKALSRTEAIKAFNYDTGKTSAATTVWEGGKAQWVNIAAVIKRTTETDGNYFVTKYYINGRPIEGELKENITAAGEYRKKEVPMTDEGYEQTGIRISAVGKNPSTGKYQGIDNIKMVKYNSSVTMPNDMNIDNSTTSVEIPFTNSTYGSTVPKAVQKGAVDLSSFTLQVKKNGIDITNDASNTIVVDNSYTKREITTTGQVQTVVEDGKHYTYMNQDGTSLKLNGISSQPGDVIEITLNGAKDVTGKALANNKITLTNKLETNLTVDNTGKATLTYDVSDFATFKPALIIGGYKDNVLVAAEAFPITLPGVTGSLDKRISEGKGATSYKAFLWSGLDKMIPYAYDISE